MIGEELDSDEILRRGDALGPLIDEHADAVNEGQCLTPEVKQALADAGVFRTNWPRKYGGPEMRFEQQIELIESISRHDASVGWNAMLLADGGAMGCRLAPDIAQELYPSLDLASSATGFPVGRADRVQDGWQVSGRWSFASGVRNADRCICSIIKHDTDGEPILGPLGTPQIWLAWFMPDQITIHDTWYTTGLAGTGSAEFSIDGAVIPDTHTLPLMFDPATAMDVPPLARVPRGLLAKQLGVPLGIASHGLDTMREFIELPRATTGQAIKAEPSVLAAYGEAEALYRAARVHVLSVWADVSDTAFADRPLSDDQMGAMLGTPPLVARLCRQSLELLMEAGGSRVVLASNNFDRLYRDMSTLIRHLVFRTGSYTLAGQGFFGLPTQMVPGRG